MTCSQCKYWDNLCDDEFPDQGECRRHAPKPLSTDMDRHRLHAYWPVTYSDDWCGDCEDK